MGGALLHGIARVFMHGLTAAVALLECAVLSAA
jgi:hypothetical protein